MAIKSETPMQINITSRHEQLSEGLRTHIEDKIRRVERYLGKIKDAHVILTFERKKMHVCEMTLSAKNLKLSAKASSHDMYQSIDVAAQRLEKQAHKQKDIRVERHQADSRRSPKAKAAPEEASENEGVRVVRASGQAVKPMTVDEAALQLVSTKDEFLVFTNAETDRTSVVYKRKDGRVGWIEP